MRRQRVRSLVEDVFRDVSHGARQLRRERGFTVVAVLTLALAIGANTAIFSLLDRLVLRDLPVRDPGSLVQFSWQYPGDPPLNLFSPADYQRFLDGNHVFSDLVATAHFQFESRGSAATARMLPGSYVSGNFFGALGVQPALGRALGPLDDEPGATPVVVVSWQFWRDQFNLDPAILNTRLVVQDLNVTVVGVAPPEFRGLVLGFEPAVWVPMGAYRSGPAVGLSLIARLKDDVSIDQARAEMRVLDRARIEAMAERGDPEWRQVVLDVEPARSGFSTPLHQQFGRPLRALMAIVVALLLMTCTNLASLLLSRGAARQREMAVRASLGATRLRIARQVLTESLLLSAAGGVLGLVAAEAAANALVRIVASGTAILGTPPSLDVTIDARILLFTITIASLATVLFSTAPAWAAIETTPASSLRRHLHAAPTARRLSFGNGLVVAEVALSLVLLTVTALYVGHLFNLRNRGLGFDRTSVLLVSVNPAETGADREQLSRLQKDLLTRFAAIPGVQSVTLCGMTPISGAAGSRFARVDGFDEDPQARRRVQINGVAPGYFETFGTPLVAGRDFHAADEGRSRVAIVNQAMAGHYFADRDPIGRRVWLDEDSEPYEIVAVAADAKYAELRSPAPRTIYLHYFQQPGMPSEFAFRTAVPPTTIVDDVRRTVDDVASAARVAKVTTLAEQLDASIVPERLIALLAAFLGAIGAVLAGIGLHGLLAYTVARRTPEIGVRMALGATPREVSGLVLKSASWLVGLGLVVGVPVAFWSTRLAAGMVENLSAASPIPIVAAAVAMVGLGLLAAYVPARRATRVDPLVALRSE